MTYAPADLLTVRHYLLVTLDVADDAIGIVGDPDHAATGGYHEGNDDLARVGRLLSDYSKRESPRDRPGSNAASAIDIGGFRHVRPDGTVVTLRSASVALVELCKAGDPRTRDIREVIYSPDGVTVLRWDRLGIRKTGDSSHLYHTHISCFRDSEGRRAQADNLLGVLAELIEGGDGMPLSDIDAQALIWRVEALAGGRIAVMAGPVKGEPVALVAAVRALSDGMAELRTAAAADAARDAAAKVAIDALTVALAAGGGSVDAAAILGRIDQVAARESEAMGRVLADLAATRGELTAVHTELASSRQEAVQLRERLAAAYAVRE